jgi:hypothetical protein
MVLLGRNLFGLDRSHGDGLIPHGHIEVLDQYRRDAGLRAEPVAGEADALRLGVPGRAA